MEAGEALTLRVEDVSGRPGELTGVVLRTYEPTPVRQGQICLVACLGQAHQGGELPFDDLEDAIVFSEFLDVISVTTFESEGGTQTAIIEFTSDLVSVNATDGPMAAFFLRLGAGVIPGQEIDLILDPLNTELFDEEGNPIEIDFRAGSLEVLDHDAPYSLEASGDEIAPGRVAILGVETEERVLLRSGQIGFRFPAEIAAGPPTVTIDPRFGEGTVEMDASTPGLLMLTFESPDSSLNQIPGSFLTIALPTRGDIPVGHRAVVSLDPALTELFDAVGVSVPLEFSGDEIVFRPREALFADGFESGGLSAWSLSVP